MKVTLVTNPVDRNGYFFPGFIVTVEDADVEELKLALATILDLYKPPILVYGGP